jgi:hypothetical protein
MAREWHMLQSIVLIWARPPAAPGAPARESIHRCGARAPSSLYRLSVESVGAEGSALSAQSCTAQAVHCVSAVSAPGPGTGHTGAAGPAQIEVRGERDTESDTERPPVPAYYRRVIESERRRVGFGLGARERFSFALILIVPQSTDDRATRLADAATPRQRRARPRAGAPRCSASTMEYKRSNSLLTSFCCAAPPARASAPAPRSQISPTRSTCRCQELLAHGPHTAFGKSIASGLLASRCRAARRAPTPGVLKGRASTELD